MKNRNKIVRIADHYGTRAQVRQCMEECAELIVALNKYLRWLDGQQGDNYTLHEIEDIINSEVADVKIMLKQLEYFIADKNDVKEYINEKLDRQLERIKNEASDS